MFPIANVIFPGPSHAYVDHLFFPASAALAVVTELAVYWYFQRRAMPLLGLGAAVLFINLFSWFAGILISFLPLVPSGFVPRLADESVVLIAGRHWTAIALWSFAWACLLSTLLEYFALRMLSRTVEVWFKRLLTCVVTANVASYIVLGVAVSLTLSSE